MNNGTICCICRSEAIQYAATYLSELGLPVVRELTPDTAHLLLPVPSFPRGTAYVEALLPSLPEDVTIYGGNLNVPLIHKFYTVDFLQDPYYLADNAAITAECALRMVEERIGPDLKNIPVLLLGWGRIGKCLGKLLQNKGAAVSIAARKDSDLAILHALDYRSVPMYAAAEDLEQYRVILNTVPAMVLPEMYPRPDCVMLELASRPGMIGENIISARGLPGRMAPEASGKLIAETFLRLYYNKEE